MGLKKTKILLISPAPSLPSNSGHRGRINNLCELNSQGLTEVFFLYLGMEGPPSNSLKEQWGEASDTYLQKGYGYRPNLSLLKRLASKIGLLSGNSRYNLHVDDWFDDDLIPQLKRLNKEHHFSHVWVEYVFLSKAFVAFNNGPVKILDTHDIFSNRYKIHLQSPDHMFWFSTFPKEEKKGLSRADIIIAIQSQEEYFFRSLIKGTKKVATIGHYTPFRGSIEKPFEGKILFIGSGKQDQLGNLIDSLLIKFYQN